MLISHDFYANFVCNLWQTAWTTMLVRRPLCCCCLGTSSKIYTQHCHWAILANCQRDCCQWLWVRQISTLVGWQCLCCADKLVRYAFIVGYLCPIISPIYFHLIVSSTCASFLQLMRLKCVAVLCGVSVRIDSCAPLVPSFAIESNTDSVCLSVLLLLSYQLTSLWPTAD